MAKPWEQYQQPAESGKPWEKFGAVDQANPVEKYTTAGEEMKQADTMTRYLAGFAEPVVKTYYGAKELITGLSPEEKANLKGWQQIGEEAPVAATIAGNIAPMALGGAALARAGLTGATALYAPKTIGQAAAVAGGYSALQPTGENQLYGVPKRIWEGAKGATTGAIFQGIANKAGNYLANRFGQRATVAPESIDDAINAAAKDVGLDPVSMPSEYRDTLKNQITEALQSNRSLDVRAAARAAEFRAAGIDPTLGQITRDPMQYATEQNLRGIAGVGEPLSARFTQQENTLRNAISNYAKGASERYQAGSQISEALKQADDALSANVSSLYKQARESAGKELVLPTQGLAQDYANILRDFGDKVPSGVRNNFESLGLLTGKQNKIFNVEEADRLLKVINSNMGTDPASNAALAALRNSVKGAVTEVDSAGGVFAPAVKAAADRFKMHDILPALEMAGKGQIDADKFVSKFIVGAKPEQVKALSQMLSTTNPQAYQQAKAQVGEFLKRSAYGIDTPADGAFRPAGFSKALDNMGERLKAFYTPQEINQLKLYSRIGSYMDKPPAKAAVSTSSSGVPVTNAIIGILEGKIPFLRTGMQMAKGATEKNAQRAAVEAAVSATPPGGLAELLPGQVDKYSAGLRMLALPAAIGINQ